MQLVNFSVTNYRSITSAHKIAMSNTTVLIGKNNEGKSNVLRSLQVAMLLLKDHGLTGQWKQTRNMFSHGQPHDWKREHPYEWKRDFPVQLQGRKATNQTIFKLEFMLNETEIDDFKSEIGASLNGSLPLVIKIDRKNEAEIKLAKPGKGTKTLSSQSGKIASFVARRIHFNYIPAVRTDSEAIELIDRMLAQELRILEDNEEYKSALRTIAALQQPLLDDLALKVQVPLNEFLPSIVNVKIEIPETSRRIALRRGCTVIIDDGTPTNIEYKGDGVKSLAVLGLLKSHNSHGGASILAIEEPESHLHPGAIHQVNEILKTISETSQVIITTHNPLFVDRADIKTNIIVNDGKATPARTVTAIRDLLGIKASDNLINASFVLVVEGDDDVIALKAILPILSEETGKAIKNNTLVIEPIGGAGNLSYKLSHLKNSLCITHTLLDGDGAGRSAFDKAQKDSLISISTCTMISCKGWPDAEFEDCIAVKVYEHDVLDELGVDLTSSKFRGRDKWSERIRTTFIDQGKPWNDKVLRQVKNIVAQAIAKDPKTALHQYKRNSIDALVVALERMIKN